jgi:hypothetical protein
VAIAALTGGAQAQQAFEGSFVMKVTGAGTNAEVTGYVKGSKVRQEFVMDGTTAAMIMDVDAGSIIMIDHARKQYADLAQVMPGFEDILRDSKAEADELAPELKATGQKETVAGHACEHYLARMKDGTEMDICVATTLGFYGGGLTGGSGFGDSGNNEGFSDAWLKVWRARFPTGFFPLKIRMTDEGEVSTLEMTKVERKPVSDDMFKPPAGYTTARIGGL